METITKLLSNPIVNIMVSMVIGWMLARYAYKINYFNKKRYRKYFRRKLRRIHFTLFQRRDAFFVGFILEIAFALMMVIFGMAFWTLAVLLALHSDSIPNSVILNTVVTVLTLLSGVNSFIFAWISTNVTWETEILRSPRKVIAKLRDELLNSDKRDLLDEREVAEFTKALSDLEAQLHHLSKMAVKPPSWIESGAVETPAPAERAHPAQ
ncbi:hypothetical protein GOL40_26885 [Sinorhizobium medicae]|nr:hypothetical protein [Sinorhizobium medicae]